MWNKLKQAADHPIWRGIKYFCGDPVQLYMVFLVMTGMYYYHEDWAWLYTLLCFPLSFVLMRFYDFVAKHRFFGPLSYIAYLVAGLYAVTLLTSYGRKGYAITFFVWFLTPQGVTDFSLIYTIAMYLLMVGFLTSTVYYFGKVRYRMSMQFLIMLIPLSLYAKEERQMPALLVIALLSSFFLLMIYCRQLRDTDEIKQMPSFHSGASIAVYVAVFSIIAAIIPKPAFQTDREFIDNAMAYSTWSDKLMEMIRSFTDVSNNRGLMNNNARTIFLAQSQESLRLHTQTRSYYSEDDSWTVTDYDRPTLEFESPMTYKPQTLLQAIRDAAAADAAFAERYGLTNVTTVVLPEQAENTFRLNCAVWPGSDVLVGPTRTFGIRDVQDYDPVTLRVSQSNSMKIQFQTVEMYYYPDYYARLTEVRKILNQLCFDDYAELLGDAAEVLKTKDPDATALLLQVQEEAQGAADYLAQTNELDWRPEAVVQLSEQLTNGLDSDIEKALAIEKYFSDADYVYDLAYNKPLGENVEDFLQTTHTGVCWEYATAMTLLCRSAGIPARFTEGYNLSERYDNRIKFKDGEEWDMNYVIKARNAHAFPEVYISGFGWMSFEPTVAADEEENTAENLNVMRWGFVMLGIFLIVLVIWLLLPMIREKLFRSRLQKLTPEEAASAIFCRMRRTMRLPDCTTVNELADASAPFFDEKALYAQMDERLYSSDAPDAKPAEAAAAYIRWDEAHKTYVKEQKRLARAQRKAARRAKKH